MDRAIVNCVCSFHILHIHYHHRHYNLSNSTLLRLPRDGRHQLRQFLVRGKPRVV